jgi:hypothetical protein
VEALKILLGRPADPTEFIALVVVGALVFLILFNVIGKLLSLPVTGSAWTLLTLIVLTVVASAASAAALVYLAPIEVVREAGLVPWLPFAASLLAILIVVVPAMRLIHRSHYGESLVAILMGVAALAAALALTHAAYGALKSGDQEFERTRERTDAVNRFINE